MFCEHLHWHTHSRVSRPFTPLVTAATCQCSPRQLPAEIVLQDFALLVLNAVVGSLAMIRLLSAGDLLCKCMKIVGSKPFLYPAIFSLVQLGLVHIADTVGIPGAEPELADRSAARRMEQPCAPAESVSVVQQTDRDAARCMEQPCATEGSVFGLQQPDRDITRCVEQPVAGKAPHQICIQHQIRACVQG